MLRVASGQTNFAEASRWLTPWTAGKTVDSIDTKLPRRVRMQMVQTRIKKTDFLEKLGEDGRASKVAKALGISMSQIYKWRKTDQQFAKDFDDQWAAAGEKLEAEAWRRGFAGVRKPVWYQGEICGHVKEYSDTLLIKLLEARKPEYRKERESSGQVVLNITFGGIPAPGATIEHDV